MGEVFAGRYELVDPIGHGGVGAVWRAWDHRRRRYVAAKVLQQSDAHALLRFVREQALRIDHPHVLAPASWAADDDKVLFTMDLVAGGSLAHVIGDYGPLPPPFTCTLLDQLLSGLAAVHAEGVIHRDIKPANILLEATGAGRPHLRLSDFGISMRKGEPRLTETDYVVGTPGYFAPEQMLGAEPDFTGDLFAVGLVALYLLEGAKPDAKALIERFAEHGTPCAPRGMPEPLWQVIATLLQPDPQTRFRTATGARKALACAAEMLPEPGPDDELVEIFDQLPPLPIGYGPAGPLPSTSHPEVASGHVPLPPGASVPDPGHGPLPPRPSAYDPGHVAPSPATSGQGPGQEPLPPATSSQGPDRIPPSPRPSAYDPGHVALSLGPSGQGPEGIPVSPGPSGHSPNGIPLPPRPSGHSPNGIPLPPRPSSHSPNGIPLPPRPSSHSPNGIPLPPRPSGHGPEPPASDPTQPPAPALSSETGSFLLPPPMQPPHPSTPPTPLPLSLPLRAPAPEPTHVSSPHQIPAPHPAQTVTSAVHHAHAPTYRYTAHAPQVPHPNAAIPHPQAPAFPGPQKRRPGPPAKVAVPMLLVALVCLAVGVWALTQL
ncbi:protein kinase domain-containing protein [Streptomyces sp. NPDC003032]